MMQMGGQSRPRIPKRLGPKGREKWSEMTEKYVFSAPEMAILTMFCTGLDEEERLTQELAAEPVVVKGSRGQPVSSPLLGEIRAHRVMLAKLAKELRLPVAKPKENTSNLKGRLPAVQQFTQGDRRSNNG
jgi:hypothetical protein